MSTNGVNTNEDVDMADCDGEKVVTMLDVLQEQQDFEDDANAVLGASDEKNCTYSTGYIKRQAIYACITCCPEAKDDQNQRAGVCLACSIACHENHDLVELYTKRNFRCDCGNPKFKSHPCQFTPNKTDFNEDNIYNQNFSGLYCICHRPYPDPDATFEDEMIQCVICEDWLHSTHLEAIVPSSELYSEMICKACMEKNDFLHDYSELAVNVENGEVDILSVDAGNVVISSISCNGDIKEFFEENTQVASDKIIHVTESAPGDKTQTAKEIDISNDFIPEKKYIETFNGQVDDVKNVNENIIKTNDKEMNHNDDLNISSKEIEESANKINSFNTEDINQDTDNDNNTCKDTIVSQSYTLEKETEIECKKITNNEDTTAKEPLEIESRDITHSHEDILQTATEDLSETGSRDIANCNEVNVGITEIETENIENTDEDTLETATKELSELTKDIDNEVKPETMPISTKESEVLDQFENMAEITDSTGETLKLIDTNNENSQNITTEISDQNINMLQNNGSADEEMKIFDSDTETGLNKITEMPVQKEDTSEIKCTSNQELEQFYSNSDAHVKENTEILNITENKIIENGQSTSNGGDNIEDNSQREISAQSKRKFIECTEELPVKKQKSELIHCKRPKGMKKRHKGATFWAPNFRQKLCMCNECVTMYKDLNVLFLIDPEDTVIAYETLGQEKNNGGPSSQYEKGLQALSSLDRIQQINAMTEYNKLRDKLLDFFKSFKDKKEVVKEEDIKAFFAGMKPRREPDGVYFCR
ncbi:uncharacterized protein LOC114243662 [Bombyx mandarina]|uniref:Uncharacterized protein LOC114243662 n=1 Tax=Bombyx mandarina TaxID=7092 RepID=A0A6J2JND5_BOMMA|nr:uncharacterized protein LOC114243662 [Bombyx mandarina]